MYRNNIKPGYDSLNINDIEGARPSKRHVMRVSKRLGGVGNSIVDNVSMNVAGRNKLGSTSKGVHDVMNMGAKYLPKH